MMRVIAGLVMGVVLATFLGFTDTTGNALAQVKDKGVKDKGKEPAPSMVFQVYKDKSGEYRFRLVNGDEKVAGSVKGYDKKEEVLELISAIKKGAALAKVVEEAAK